MTIKSKTLAMKELKWCRLNRTLLWWKMTWWHYKENDGDLIRLWQWKNDLMKRLKKMTTIKSKTFTAKVRNFIFDETTRKTYCEAINPTSLKKLLLRLLIYVNPLSVKLQCSISSWMLTEWESLESVTWTWITYNIHNFQMPAIFS